MNNYVTLMTSLTLDKMRTRTGSKAAIKDSAAVRGSHNCASALSLYTCS